VIGLAGSTSTQVRQWHIFLDIS